MTGRLPKIFRRLFANDGAGPLLREDVVPQPTLATADRPGIVKPGDGLELDDSGALSVKSDLVRPYALCEFYYFRHPALKHGFQPAQGGLLANAAELYPEAWAYLQTSEGQKLCLSEADWLALTRASWATLADGRTVGWNGIGGAPFYAPNMATGALRLPDLRGMYAEAAGYDSLGVGGVHGDAIRNITGSTGGVSYTTPSSLPSVPASSALRWKENGGYRTSSLPNQDAVAGLALDISYNVPTASKNQPRAWGALACVYLGVPK